MEEKKKIDSEDAGTKKKRRPYRNPDDMVLGGVCSGLAVYMGIDPLMVRLAFIVLGLLSGFGVLLYIVLWLVLPKAESSTQKLGMQGRQVNLNEIKEEVKERSKMLSEESREAWKKLKRKDSATRRLLNLPVRLVAGIVEALKGVGGLIFPLVFGILGIAIAIGSFGGILGLTVAGAILLFNVDSAILFPDVQLQALVGRPSYYVGVLCLYIAAVIPMIFLAMLGVSLALRKNIFRAASSLALLGIWIVAVAGGGAAVVANGSAVAELGPKITQSLQAIEHGKQVTQAFAHQGFNAVSVSKNIEVVIKQGAKYSISFRGNEDDMQELRVGMENGTLEVERISKPKWNFCLFCFRLNQPIRGEIVMPTLTAYTGHKASSAKVEGLIKNATIRLSDASHLTATQLDAEAVTLVLERASNARLEGTSKHLKAALNKASSLEMWGLKAEKIAILANEASRATMKGSSGTLSAQLKEASSLVAGNLKVDDVTVFANAASRAWVWAEKTLEAEADNASNIEYQGSVENPTLKIGKASSIERANALDEELKTIEF